MKLKTLVASLLIVITAGFTTPVHADNLTANTEKTAKEKLAEQLTSRLHEIRDMDKSNLTASEKKELRKEVKAIRKEGKSNGIYLSIGAVIIIVLLLILLL